jgi:hypothetical protein
MPKDYTPSQECMNQVPWILAHTRVETTGDLQRQKAKRVPSNPPGIWCLLSWGIEPKLSNIIGLQLYHTL